MRHPNTHTALAARLHARRAEIEQATLTRIYAISDPGGAPDSTYVEGLRAAVMAALDYGLSGVECGGREMSPVPPALLAQARLAGRNRVSLDTVLRRYFAGYSLFGDFLIEEAQREGLMGGSELKLLLRSQAVLFDRLLAEVSEEFARETDGRIETAEARRVERVERLLAGELLDTSELAYDFNATHIGLLAAGPSAPEAIRELAAGADCRLLLVQRPGEIVWAWLGARRCLDPADLLGPLNGRDPALYLAVGESARGLAGWRLTHAQASAALPIALRGTQSYIRYSNVALLASILRDDLLATSLRQLYLTPLQGTRDGGEIARQTLRAYFAAGRNLSSCAAALGVSRRTVANRLHAIELCLGCPLMTISAEVEVALRLEELGDPRPRPRPF